MRYKYTSYNARYKNSIYPYRYHKRLSISE